MSRAIRFFTSLVALVCAALAVSAAPAAAAPPQSTGCPDGFELYVLDALLDAPFVVLDLNDDGAVCVSLNGAVVRVLDNSDGGTTGLLGGFVTITGPTTIEGIEVTIEDILTSDQKNRNNVVGGFICTQNTGNSCLSNNKFLNNNRVVILVEDVI